MKHCAECGKQFLPASSLSRALCCSRECSETRHRRQSRLAMRDMRQADPLSEEMREVRTLREFLRPLDRLVLQQRRGERQRGFWR